MTVGKEEKFVNNWNGDGHNTMFDFDFPIENESQLIVLHTNSDGVQKRLLNGVDYSINEVSDQHGSFINFPLENSDYGILQEDEIISNIMYLPIQQDTPYNESEQLVKSRLERNFDYLTKLIAIQKREIDRSVKIQEGASLTPDELIKSLQYSAETAVSAADSATNAASAAHNSELCVSRDAEAVTQQVENFNLLYNNATADLTTKYQDAINSIGMDRIAALEDIQEEAQEQYENVRAAGFYRRGDKLYYTDDTGAEKAFSAGTDTIPMFTGMYFDFAPNHPSWLKAGMQANNEGIYTSTYNELVNVLNGSTKYGNLKVVEQSAMIAGVDYSQYWKVNQDEMYFVTPTDISSKPYEKVAAVIGKDKPFALAHTFGGTPVRVQATNVGNVAGTVHMSDYGQSTNLYFPNNASDSPFYAELQENTTAQLYFKVANAVQNLEALNGGAVLEALADKIGRQECKAYVTETYVNGNSGYRIYSDGYCEQWGLVSSPAAGNRTISFSKAYEGLPAVTANYVYNGTNWTGQSNIQSISSDKFVYYNYSTAQYISWRACGYLAQGQY